MKEMKEKHGKFGGKVVLAENKKKKISKEN